MTTSEKTFATSDYIIGELKLTTMFTSEESIFQELTVSIAGSLICLGLCFLCLYLIFKRSLLSFRSLGHMFADGTNVPIIIVFVTRVVAPLSKTVIPRHSGK